MARPELETLLEVQEHDTALDQLRHRKVTIPERAQLAELEARADTVTAQIGEASADRDEAVQRQEALEADLAATEKRMKEIEQRLFSPTAAVARHGGHERRAGIAQAAPVLARGPGARGTGGREPLDAEVERLEGEWARLGNRAGRAHRRHRRGRDRHRRRARGRGGEAGGRRGRPARRRWPQQYERLRSRLGGIGAARLVGTSCSGCHLTLPATEIDRIKQATADARAHVRAVRPHLGALIAVLLWFAGLSFVMVWNVFRDPASTTAW